MNRVFAAVVGVALLLAACSDEADRPVAAPTDEAGARGVLLEVADLDGFEVERPLRDAAEEALPFCLQVRREDHPDSVVEASFVDLRSESGGIEARLYESVAPFRPGAAEAYLEAVRKAVVSCETAGNPPVDVPGVRYELRPEPTIGDDALTFDEITNGGLIAVDEQTTLIRVDHAIVTLQTSVYDESEVQLPADLIEQAVDRGNPRLTIELRCGVVETQAATRHKGKAAREGGVLSSAPSTGSLRHGR